MTGRRAAGSGSVWYMAKHLLSGHSHQRTAQAAMLSEFNSNMISQRWQAPSVSAEERIPLPNAKARALRGPNDERSLSAFVGHLSGNRKPPGFVPLIRSKRDFTAKTLQTAFPGVVPRTTVFSPARDAAGCEGPVQFRGRSHALPSLRLRPPRPKDSP